jgi:hypothetical protein
MRTKGSSVVSIREMARKNKIEQAMLEKLTPEEQKLFKNTMAITWITDSFEAKITHLYADIMLPGDPDNCLKVSNQMAKHQFQGIYKYFFRVLSVKLMLQKTATLWSTMNEEGTAMAIWNEHEKEISLIVKGCSEFCPDSRDIYSGYIQGVLELTGATNVRVEFVEDPAQLQWRIQWT